MSFRRLASLSISLFAGLAAFATSHAFAQGKFAGDWQVVDLQTPDWIEPTSAAPGAPLKKGDQITFSEDSVAAPDPFECSSVTYQQLVVSPPQIFREGISDASQVRSLTDKFGFSRNIATLRVECDNATFEYYEGTKGLVMEYDNMIYVLSRRSSGAR